MSSPTVDKPLDPGMHFGAAICGALISGVFSYATAAYSAQHPTAFKVSFAVGAVFSLLDQVALYASEDIESKEFKVLPLALFGYLVPLATGFKLTMRKIVLGIFPESWVVPVSSRGVTCLGATALGYATTNALFESYHYYRSRQIEQ